MPIPEIGGGGKELGRGEGEGGGEERGKGETRGCHGIPHLAS